MWPIRNPATATACRAVLEDAYEPVTLGALNVVHALDEHVLLLVVGTQGLHGGKREGRYPAVRSRGAQLPQRRNCTVWPPRSAQSSTPPPSTGRTSLPSAAITLAAIEARRRWSRS